MHTNIHVSLVWNMRLVSLHFFRFLIIFDYWVFPNEKKTFLLFTNEILRSCKADTH